MTNPFDQFDAPSPDAAAAPPANPFDQFDVPKLANGPTQPWWYPIAQGALPFGIAPRIEAGTAAAKESLSGGLPFGKAYSQALTQYQTAGDQQAKDNPTMSAIGNAAGSVLPLIAGGEAINAGLGAAGPVGRFLAGEADVPFVGRSATGQFAKLSGLDKMANYGTQAFSRAAMMGREGAQAGALGAASAGDSGGDIWDATKQGALLGGGVGLAAAPAIWGLGQIAKVPAAAANILPGWAKTGVGLLGGEKLLEHGGQLFSLAGQHPIGAAALGTGAGAMALSGYLADHPEMRDLLSRLGIAGYASAPQRQPPQ